MIDLAKLKKYVAGFAGHFEFVPEHSEDQGVGLVCDWVNIDDELIYVDVEDEKHLISDVLEQHVAEPIADMLNSLPDLMNLMEALEQWHKDPETHSGEDRSGPANARLHGAIKACIG